MKLETLAIIPARVGSTRMPKKNIAMVAGHPLLYYTVKAALAARCIDRVIVSTESPEIGQIAYDCGAEVPCMRPERLARDPITIPDVCLHMVHWLDEYEDYRPDFVLYLCPTYPLRTADDIDAMMQVAQEKNANAVYSVAPVGSRHTSIELSLGPDNQIVEMWRRNVLAPDACPPLYRSGGGMGLVRTGCLEKTHGFFVERLYACVIPMEHTLDVDLPWHLYLADLVLADIQRKLTAE